MSVQSIRQSLNNLTRLHQTLLEISSQKTAIIKKGSVDKLQSLLVDERKQIQALEQAENKRQKEVEAWFAEQQMEEQATITGMLEVIQDEVEKQELEAATITLTKTITELKRQEELNQALIQQSMQFVQLSLDMMNPSIKNMNYGKQKETESGNRSVFDSKA